MKGKKWLVLPVSLAIVLLASSVGGTMASFVDQESSCSNTFEAWASILWQQTTQSDFEAGVLNNIDTSSSAGDALLSLIPLPTLITSDNSEVSTSGDTDWHLVKTLTFTKDGSAYDELRIDSHLKAKNPAIASSSIRIDDVEKFSHSTTSTSYESYSDVFDFSSYPDGEHTVKLYLKTSNKNKPAYNSIFELYCQTESYVSPGTIASQVLDTGIAGASWNALFWDETRPSNTDITFEVRASDTSFAKNDATPNWIDLGLANSPITSGLPSGRYMQWRATLTTSDTSKTPTLHEVRVYYY